MCVLHPSSGALTSAWAGLSLHCSQVSTSGEERATLPGCPGVHCSGPHGPAFGWCKSPGRGERVSSSEGGHCSDQDGPSSCLGGRAGQHLPENSTRQLSFPGFLASACPSAHHLVIKLYPCCVQDTSKICPLCPHVVQAAGSPAWIYAWVSLGISQPPHAAQGVGPFPFLPVPPHTNPPVLLQCQDDLDIPSPLEPAPASSPLS